MTLDETQQELENLVNEHERLVSDLAKANEELELAHEQPTKLKREAQVLIQKLESQEQEIETLQFQLKQ